MNKETITALREAHPELFRSKLLAGLTEAQAAEVIQAQQHEQAAHPPGAQALSKARSLTELARGRFEQLKALFAEARAALDEAARANPDLPGADLPVLPDFPPADPPAASPKVRKK